MLQPITEDGDVPNPLAAIMADKQSLPGKVFGNPPRPPSVANTRRWRGAEIPSSNGHGSARGIAKVHAALAGGGESAGVRLMSGTTVDEARKERVAAKAVILGMTYAVRLGTCFRSPSLATHEGRAHSGTQAWEGSMGYADPEHQIGFAYVMNQMGPAIDTRSASLSRALYRAVQER